MSTEAAATKTATGDRAVRPGRRGVVDPEVAAVRRLQASADRYYDPELDVDWDAPVQEGAWWGAKHLSNFEGARLWERLSEEQRFEVLRQEMASVIMVGVLLETGLSVALYRDFMSVKALGNRAKYVLTEIGEEARHSVMFANLLAKMGEGAAQPVKFFLPQFFLSSLPFAASLVPAGPLLFSIALMGEEVFDQLQRMWMNEPECQPHARMAMRIHVIEESRHMAFAKEEVIRGMRESGPVTRFLIQTTIANCALMFPVMNVLNPAIYRSAGVNPFFGFLRLVASKKYGENVQRSFGSAARYFYENGVMDSAVARFFWRLSRALPEDLKARMREDKARARAERRVGVAV